MTALHDAYEKLRRERDGLPPTVRDALDVVLGASCRTCREWKRYRPAPDHPAGDCAYYKAMRYHDDMCAYWEQREETTA